MDKISPVLAKVLNGALQFVEGKVITRIDKEELKQFVAAVNDKLQDTISILADDDSNNNSQLQTLWAELLTDERAIALLNVVYRENILRIKDEKVKEFLLLIEAPLFKTIVLFAHKDKNLIQDVWTSFLDEEKTIEFMRSNATVIVSKIVKNKELAPIIGELIAFLVTKIG